MVRQNKLFPLEMKIVSALSVQKQKDGTVAEKEVLYPTFYLTQKEKIQTTYKDAVVLLAQIANPVNEILKKDLIHADPIQQRRIKNCVKWVNKKTKIHPWNTRKVVARIMDMPEFYEPLEKMGFSSEKILDDMFTIVTLHDIGRVMEINMAEGQKYDLTTVKGLPDTHALAGIAILQEIPAFARPEILLPIKYHEAPQFEAEMKNDDMYKALSEEEKKLVWAYTLLQRDVDRLSNLESYRKVGSKTCGERSQQSYQNPENEMRITPICLKRFQNRELGRVSEANTYLDCHLRWLGWAFQMHLPYVRKTMNKELFEDLWDRTFEELSDEFYMKDRARTGHPIEKMTPERVNQFSAIWTVLHQCKLDMMREIDPNYHELAKEKKVTRHKSQILSMMKKENVNNKNLEGR